LNWQLATASSADITAVVSEDYAPLLTLDAALPASEVDAIGVPVTAISQPERLAEGDYAYLVAANGAIAEADHPTRAVRSRYEDGDRRPFSRQGEMAGIGRHHLQQYYDTAKWLADSLAARHPEEAVGLYAGVDRSRLYQRGDSVSVERETLKPMVAEHQIRVMIATDAACERLEPANLGHADQRRSAVEPNAPRTADWPDQTLRTAA
jgi:hypothetical protein